MINSNISKRVPPLLICLCIAFGLSACSTTDQEITEYINANGKSFTFTSVSTPKNSSLQAIAYTSTLTSEEITDINDDMDSLISTYNWNSSQVSGRGPTLDYNCHSYSWYSQATSNSRWINQYYFNTNTGQYTTTANLSKYWTDGSYSLITSVSGTSIPSSAANGSKVFYATGDHSAIKTSSSQFTSKWGAAGLYTHSPGHAPYDTTTISYYKYYKK